VISEEVKHLIRERLDLPTIVRESGVPLRRSGKGWRGPCPFELEPPGSPFPTKFSVHSTFYKCFTCQKAGDVFEWFILKQGLSFHGPRERD
jgi:DNA primase